MFLFGFKDILGFWILKGLQKGMWTSQVVSRHSTNHDLSSLSLELLFFLVALVFLVFFFTKMQQVTNIYSYIYIHEDECIFFSFLKI